MLTFRRQNRTSSPGGRGSPVIPIILQHKYKRKIPRLTLEEAFGHAGSLKQKAEKVLSDGLQSDTSTEDSSDSPVALGKKRKTDEENGGREKSREAFCRARRGSSSSWDSDTTPDEPCGKQKGGTVWSGKMNERNEPLMRIRDALQTSRLTKRPVRAGRAQQRYNASPTTAEETGNWEIYQKEHKQNARDRPWLGGQEATPGAKWRQERSFENWKQFSSLSSQQVWLMTDRKDRVARISADKSESSHGKGPMLLLEMSPDWGQTGEEWDLARIAEESFREQRDTSLPVTSSAHCSLPTGEEQRVRRQALPRCSKDNALLMKQRTSSARRSENQPAWSAFKQKKIVLQMGMVTDVVHEAAALRFGWAIHRIIRRHLIRVIRHWKSAGSRPSSSDPPFSASNGTSFSISTASPQTGECRSEARPEEPFDEPTHQAFVRSPSASQGILIRNEGEVTTVAQCHSSDSDRVGQREARAVSVATPLRSAGARLMSRCLLHALRKTGLGDAWHRLKTWSQNCQFEERMSGFYPSLQAVSEWATRFSRVLAVMALRRIVCFSARRILLRTFLTLSQAAPASCGSRRTTRPGITVADPSPNLVTSAPTGTRPSGVHVSGAPYPEPQGRLTRQTGATLFRRGECYTRLVPAYGATHASQTLRAEPEPVRRGCWSPILPLSAPATVSLSASSGGAKTPVRSRFPEPRADSPENVETEAVTTCVVTTNVDPCGTLPPLGRRKTRDACPTAEW